MQAGRTRSSMVWSRGMLWACPLCVCENMRYVVLGRSCSAGTSFTLRTMSTFLSSSTIVAPA